MANTDDLIREAIRNGEDYLQAQLQLALAADQRAVSLGGVLAAAASVVLGFLFAGTDELSATTSVAFLVLVAGLGVAAGLAFYAARPVDIWIAGNIPSSWYEDIEGERLYSEVVREQMFFIDKHARENNRIIDRNADYLKWAMRIAAGTIVACVLLGAVSVVLAKSQAPAGEPGKVTPSAAAPPAGRRP